MKFTCSILLAIILPIRLFAYPNVGDFEGKIKVLKEGAYDTLWVEIIVKGGLARVDEYSKQKTLLRSYIVNLTSGSIFILSISNRMYTQVKSNSSQVASNVEVVKSENHMEINGVKCYQWRVKDKNSFTETTYWVAPLQYGFTDKLFRLLANTGSVLEEMAKIPYTNGVWPLMVVDRTKFRKIRSTTRVVEVKPMRIAENVFEIPKGFSELIAG